MAKLATVCPSFFHLHLFITLCPFPARDNILSVCSVSVCLWLYRAWRTPFVHERRAGSSSDSTARCEPKSTLCTISPSEASPASSTSLTTKRSSLSEYVCPPFLRTCLLIANQADRNLSQLILPLVSLLCSILSLSLFTRSTPIPPRPPRAARPRATKRPTSSLEAKSPFLPSLSSSHSGTPSAAPFDVSTSSTSSWMLRSGSRRST
jgi:hypothetical protein